MAGTISSLGAGSKLDLQGIIDQLRAADEKVLTTRKDNITTLEATRDEFDVVKNKLYTMKSKALDLSLSSNFLGRSVTSSDEQALTATVVDGTTVQSSSVTVSRLASRSSWQSAGKATDTAVVTATDDTFSYKVGTETYTVDVAAGTTLTGLAFLINEDLDNPGVTASVINDGDPTNPYRLVLQADDFGEDNRIVITDPAQLPDLVMTEEQGSAGSLNAQIVVNGTTYQRQTNTINDVLAGVTMNLNSIGASTVAVADSSSSSIAELVTGMVEAYNDVIQEIRTKSAYDENTKTFGILANTGAGDLIYDLETIMTKMVLADPENKVTSLFDLGMEFNRDGTITLDSDVLAAAVADNPDSVQAFFLGDQDAEIEGFADSVNSRLRVLTGITGQVEAEKTTAEDRIDSLKTQIEAETERLDKKYEIMAKQFAELDRYVKQMTSISDYLTKQFNSSSNSSGSSN